MSEPSRVALLLPRPRPETQAEKEAFAAQFLACQLYAGNHDLVIVGLCDLGAVEAAVPEIPCDPQLPVVELGGFDLVLAIAPSPDDDAGARFDAVLEQLGAERIDVVLVDRREG